MAAGPIGTQARMVLNSLSQGNVRLRRAKSYKISDEATTEAVTAVGEDDPVGFRDKPGAKQITLEVYAEQSVLPGQVGEVDWQFLKTSKEYFGLTLEIVNGARIQFPSCRVAKVEPSGDDEGTHMLSVEIIALRRKQL